MKKTWNIGERCAYGTFKIIKISKNSVTVGLSKYKQKEIETQETFEEYHDLREWLENSMDYYYSREILKTIDENMDLILY